MLFLEKKKSMVTPMWANILAPERHTDRFHKRPNDLLASADFPGLLPSSFFCKRMKEQDMKTSPIARR